MPSIFDSEQRDSCYNRQVIRFFKQALIELRMKVELLQNFLSEVGRK
jgi:hypothetical protein